MKPTRGGLCVVVLPTLLLAPGCAAAPDDRPPPPPAEPVVAVLGAMTVEVELLEQELADKKERTVQGVRFATGTLKGKRVVLAHSGMGKVNAAMAAALLLEGFGPTHVLFTGIAGGLNPDLRPGDVVIGTKAAFHDYGEWAAGGFRVGPTVDPFTGKPNPLFFPADAGLLKAAEAAAADLKLAAVRTARGERVPRVVPGVIVTGDAFVASAAKQEALRKEFGADATEMEGAAVAQVCWQRRVPCLVLRSLSDDAGAKAPDDERHFEKTAAQNSARLVTGVVGRVGAK
ncbi:MAG: 5'-methylthioadenosine/adenosylhomocysteine nucleosidase [Isosphaera sp.]|nr:5'-methylthioadenosine/adenosylhomocysteine nucleosidase [Isosphaera sp.]